MSASNVTDSPILAGYGVTFGYGSGGGATGELVLRDLSIELFRSEIIALIGPNGCGKSTLLKILAGLLPLNTPSSGIIRYLGQDFLENPPSRRAQCVAYVGSELHAEFPITAYEAVMMGATSYSQRLFIRYSADQQTRAQQAMERCQCWGLRERDLRTLSGGERQLVALARGLMQGAKVLLLDESLSKMDLHHQSKVGNLLRLLAKDGFSIILVAHDLNLATEWADQCLLLSRGAKVAFGKPEEVLSQENLSMLYPGAQLVVRPSPVNGKPKVFFSSATRDQK